MFFDDISQIESIVRKTGVSILVVPVGTKLKTKNVLYLEPPKDKRHISVEQIREFTNFTKNRQSTDWFLVITPADAMNESAQNAFLKNLEEPKDNYHFVLITENPSKLLPTILSRAQTFILKKADSLSSPIETDPKIKDLAKKLLVAKPKDLPDLAATICKNKDARGYALKITETAIEILYKSYFATNNEVFVKKIPAFIQLYENLSQNGHVKLHLVADLC